jgi:hypothetical protein
MRCGSFDMNVYISKAVRYAKLLRTHSGKERTPQWSTRFHSCSVCTEPAADSWYGNATYQYCSVQFAQSSPALIQPLSSQTRARVLLNKDIIMHFPLP